jgi:hypothetical protein
MPKTFLLKSFTSGEGFNKRLSDLKDIRQSPFDVNVLVKNYAVAVSPTASAYFR